MTGISITTIVRWLIQNSLSLFLYFFISSSASGASELLLNCQNTKATLNHIEYMAHVSQRIVDNFNPPLKDMIVRITDRKCFTDYGYGETEPSFDRRFRGDNLIVCRYSNLPPADQSWVKYEHEASLYINRLTGEAKYHWDLDNKETSGDYRIMNSEKEYKCSPAKKLF